MNACHIGFNPDYSEDSPTFDDVSALAGEAILEFGVPWCGHCQAAHSAVEGALKNYPELPHIKVYDGNGKRLGRAFKVRLWPTLIILRDGSEVARLVRPLQSSEVEKLISAPSVSR